MHSPAPTQNRGDLSKDVRAIGVEHPCCLTTMVFPEFVPDCLAEQLLHNQAADLLRVRLHGHADSVVVDVPYHI